MNDLQTSLCPFCLKTVLTDHCPHCGHDVRYTGHPNHLPVGYTLMAHHAYVLGAAIGQGGFGITYIALDVDGNQRVAIKEYFPAHCCGRTDLVNVLPYLDQEETYNKGRVRFLDEARMLKSLSDIPSIVNVLDFFEANNSAYLVMEYLEGNSLKNHIEKNGKLPAQQFLNQMKPLMADMEKMHQRGVVHRDIAPDNIILLPDGRLKLIDFGAARSYVGDRSMTVVVKKGFAPVEQYMRKGSNASTDVYALAATIYYCITGIIPPDSAERQYGEASLQAPTSLHVDISPAQENALEKALEIQPRDRYQTIDTFQNALFVTSDANAFPVPSPDPIIAPTPTPNPVSTFRPVAPAPSSKKKPIRKWLSAVLISLLLILSIGTYALYRSGFDMNTLLYGEVYTMAKPEDLSRVHADLRSMQLFWGQTQYRRNQVKFISFIDSVENAPNNAHDVSEAKDRSILAWMEGAHLYVASDGRIAPNPNASYMFSNFPNLTQVDFGNNFDTSNVTNMHAMFSNCPNLTSLDLHTFNTRNVQDMSSMFSRNTSLETVDMSSFNTQYVRTMNCMFYNCKSLELLDVTTFQTSNVTDMAGMFNDCHSLNNLDLSGFNVKNVSNMKNMFLDCPVILPEWYTN